MASKTNSGKYVSVGMLHYRSELDDKKTPARTYKPNDTIDEDLSGAEIEKLVKKGAIREKKAVQAEQKARQTAAEIAAEGQAAADAAEQKAAAAAAQAGSEADAAAAAAAADASKPGRR